MNKLMEKLPDALTRRAGRTNLILQKNSPHILFGLGLAGIVTSTVLACRATLKLDKTLDEVKNEVEDIKALQRPQDMHGADEAGYTQREYYKDMGYVYTKNIVKLGRLYAPAIIVGGISVAALTGSHVQLTRRNSALTVTLAAVSRAYEEYRQRVAEEIGEERERDLHNNVKTEKVEIDGKKQLVKVTNPEWWSPYARFFEESNPNWKPNSEINRNFLQCQQHYANHLLRARGHVFLNDVYDMLTMERSSAGAVVGWLYDSDNEKSDGYIDFGLFEAYNSPFINNLEQSVILDFNVDGVIYDLIEK